MTCGYLGVMIQPVTPDLAKAFKLPANSGALVGDVTKDSPADEGSHYLVVETRPTKSLRDN